MEETKRQWENRKRSIDRFYACARGHRWEYFLTLTFATEEDRSNADTVKKAYCEFRRRLQQKDPNVKMLMVPCLHNVRSTGTRAWALHVLVAGVQPDLQVDWLYGNGACSPIPDDNRVMNYMGKYILKYAKPLGKFKFYHTRNV